MEDSNRLLKNSVTKNSKDSRPKETSPLQTSQRLTAFHPYQHQQNQQSFTSSTSPSSFIKPTSSDPIRIPSNEPTNGTVQKPAKSLLPHDASKSQCGASPDNEIYESPHGDTDQLLGARVDIRPDPQTIQSEPQPSISIADAKSHEKDKNKPDKPATGVVAVEKPELTNIPQTNFAIGFLVMCCFNLPFGLLALYFSLRAAAAYRDGNKVKGASRARTSIVLSLLGIMLTMMIVSSVVLYIAVNKHGKRQARRPSSSALGF